MSNSAIVIFDGECNVCHGAVRFIIKRDPAAQFRFAASRSGAGRAILSHHGLSRDAERSIVLIQNNQIYLESDAILEIVARLQGPFRWLRVFRILPRLLRNPLYRLVSTIRYRLFGKRDACMIPQAETGRRFL